MINDATRNREAGRLRDTDPPFHPDEPMRQLQLVFLILTLAAGVCFLSTGLLLASKVDPIALIDFTWHFAAVSLMTGVVYRQFMRPRAS